MVGYAEANAYQANPTGDRPDLEIIRAARGVLCRKVVDFTKAFVPTPFDPLYEAAVGNACPSPLLPSPPLPARPFSGGQCLVSYRVDGSYTVPSSGPVQGGTKTFFAGTGGTIRGRVRNIVVVDNHPLAPNSRSIIVSANNTGGVPSDFVAGTIGAVGQQYSDFSCRVTRLDGQVDNCGNLPLDYPTTSPPTPQQLTETISIPIRPGVNISVPIVAILPTIKGELNVDLGGINVKFDLGGITIGGKGSGDLTGVLEAIADIAVDIADIKEDGCKQKKPPGLGDYDIEELSEGTGGKLDGIADISWVVIDMAKRPRNAKIQQGGGGDNLFYWGWFSPRAGGRNLPRVPLSYERNIIPLPDGCKGYNYGIYTGYSANVTIYRVREQS